MSKAEITAIEHKLLNATTADEAIVFFDEDTVRYTFIPPLQYVGVKAVRALFEQVFPTFKNPKGEFLSLNVVVDGNLGIAHSLQHLTWTSLDDKPAEGTFRVTDCFHKVKGEWKIFHSHVSVPINPATGMAEMNLKQ